VLRDGEEGFPWCLLFDQDLQRLGGFGLVRSLREFERGGLTKYVARRHAADDLRRSPGDEYMHIARPSFLGSYHFISQRPPS
jgi:hypothetical protein